MPVGFAEVSTALKSSGDYEKSGGLSAMMDLEGRAAGIIQESMDRYVLALQDMTRRRSLMFSMEKALVDLSGSSLSTQDVTDSLSQSISGKPESGDFKGLQSAVDIIERSGVSQILAPRIKTGLRFPWSWMNSQTNGMGPAELWVLAGHTGTGKTSAMLAHATLAARRGFSVAVFSLEVGREAMVRKAAYMLAKVDSSKANRGELSPEETKKVSEAISCINELPIYFDTDSTTALAIHASARRLKSKRKIDHIIVDYLQLLGNTGRQDSKAQAVGANAWAMKMLAVEYRVPVLLLSQFSRQSNRPGQEREPDLTDLKESGDIENHANGVWFIHRPKCKDQERVPVKFMIPKQRDGRRDVDHAFTFIPSLQRFEEDE